MNRYVPGAKPPKGQPQKILVTLSNDRHRTRTSVLLQVGALIGRGEEGRIRRELCPRGPDCCRHGLGLDGPQDGVPKGYFLTDFWSEASDDVLFFVAADDFPALTDDELAKAAEEVAGHSGVSLSPEQMRQLLADAPDVRWGIRNAQGVDTMEREMILDVLGRTLVGTPWPCYADGQDACDRFHIALAQAAKRAGYRLDPV